MSERATATALAVTRRLKDNSRSLHFATDQGPIVVRCDDVDVLDMWAEMLRDEADEWTAEEADEDGEEEDTE